MTSTIGELITWFSQGLHIRRLWPIIKFAHREPVKSEPGDPPK